MEARSGSGSRVFECQWQKRLAIALWVVVNLSSYVSRNFKIGDRHAKILGNPPGGAKPHYSTSRNTSRPGNSHAQLM